MTKKGIGRQKSAMLSLFAAPTAAPSTLIPESLPADTPVGHGLGVCMTGLIRSALSPPVVHAFETFIRSQHEEVDLHMTMVMTDEEELTQRTELIRKWRPTSLDFLVDDAENMYTYPWACSPGPSLGYPAQEPADMSIYSWDNYRAILQFFGLHQCYGQVTREEEARGAHYRWLFRMRSDLVALAPLPLTALAATDREQFAYLPLGGFSPNDADMCASDHLFLCPRALCRSYFELTELWTSPLCTRNASEATATIFATNTPRGLVMATRPEGRFLLPDADHTHAAPFTLFDHFRARYQPYPFRDCDASIDAPSCCGLVRELAWPYSFARGNADAGVLECQYTLVGGWRTRDFEAHGRNAEALAICHAASDLYARNLMRKDAEELCNRLPVGFYMDQRAAIPGNNRQGWCMEAATRNASVV